MFHFDNNFKDRNSERYMLPMRVKGLADVLLKNYVIKSEFPAGDFEFLEGDLTYIEVISCSNWTVFKRETDRWGAPDLWCWFRQTVEIPADFAGQDIWYYVYPYNEEEIWYWGQPQLQLFVNGECVCGLDNNHRKHLLIKNAKGGEKLEIYIKAYSDLKYYKGTMIMSSTLQVVRSDVMELYRDITIPLQAAGYMNTDNEARIKIIKELNTAITILELDMDAESEEFKKSVKDTHDYLKKNLYGTLSTGQEPVLWSIGHSHIDIAWQWTYHVSHNKAARTFATQLRLMENNPEYKFMASQAQIYDFVKKDEPGLYAQVKERVKEGRWEPEGALWVETDTNLTSGESLVRQFLFGKRFFKQEFGVDNKVCWLPDVFGYSAALPQIAKLSGVPYFYTTKIGWNEYNKFPFDTFNWRGIDGSEVLSHFGCAIEYKEEESDWMTTYNPTLEPGFVLGAWQRYQQKDLNNDILYDFGFGDGGGGPTQEMIDQGRRFNEGIPGCPKVEFRKVGDFFKKLEEDVAEATRLPVWDGEMYLEYHRGTYTSQGANKRYNRLSEELYHDVENLNTISMLTAGTTYPQAELNENWKNILLNQFHDVLPGSSITKVYEDSTALYNDILRYGKSALCDAEKAIADCIDSEGKSVTVFNTLSHARDAIAEVKEDISSLECPCGCVLPTQKTYDGKTIFVAKSVPSKGYNTYKISDKKADVDNKMIITSSSIETDMLSVKFDEKMHITSLINKVSGREAVPAGEVLGMVVAYEDRPCRDDAWNVQVYNTEKGRVIDNVESVTVLEAGPVRGKIRVIRRFKASTLQVDITVYAGSPLVDYKYEVDWAENHYFVKALHPVDVNATRATYDIQFGYLERSTTTNTLWDFGHFEACGHKYADLSDNSHGIAIINDCKYGYSATKNSLNLSLLKCATYPDPVQDQGHHTFSYAIYAHEGNQIDGDVRTVAYDYNYPVHAVVAEGKGKLPKTYSFMSIDSKNVIIETIKKAEDSNAVIVRLYESNNMSSAVTLTLAEEFKKAEIVNLMEEVQEEVALSGNALKLNFKPFEIKTIKLSK